MGKYDHLTINDTPLTEKEKFVLEQVEKGEIADLKAQFGEEESNRRLSAKFLEALLTDEITLDSGKFTPHRRGIRINHAVIKEPLDLENVEIFHIVGLSSCIFKEKVNFRDARFARHLFLNGCTFQQKADFHRVKVVIDLYCRNAVFKGPVDFVWADIGEQFSATEARFEHKDQEASFHAMKVGHSAFFDKAVFQGPVDFGGANIGSQFNANEAKFENKDQEANFNAMKIGQSAFFKNVVFKGPVDFGGADIGEQFNANEARFENKDHNANFNGIKIKHDAFFTNTVFQGPVDFGGADIGRQFSADEAKFENKAKKANFNSMQVGQSAFFQGTQFNGPVDFVSANIKGQFGARMAIFLAEYQIADFNGMQVGQTAFLQGAEFHGPVDFISADIKGVFEATGAKFLNEIQGAYFNALKVGQSAFFDGAEFAGPIGLNDAHLLDLIMDGKPIPALNLERTRIDRELRIRGTEQKEEAGKKTEKVRETKIHILKARNLTIQGPATLENVIIKDEADLRDGNFQSLDLLQVTWPPDQKKVWLEGLTYKAISAGPKPDDWRKLLEWVKGSRFNTQNYSQLEAYFSRCGHKARADEVFLSMKKLLSEQKPDSWSLQLPKKLVFHALNLLVGYGRKPWKAIGWAILVILLMVGLFYNPYVMIPKKFSHEAGFTAKTSLCPKMQEKARSEYSPWLYSLDLFLPVDLGVAKHWEPAFEYKWRWYEKFEIAAGWVLITVLLAALTGIIK